MAGLTAVLLAATTLFDQQSINTLQLKRSDADPVRVLVAGPENADATWDVLESFFARNLGR